MAAFFNGGTLANYLVNFMTRIIGVIPLIDNGDGTATSWQGAAGVPNVAVSSGTITVTGDRGTTQYKSSSAEACASIKASAGYINSSKVYNDGGATAYLQFHNLAAAPSPGATPADVVGEIAPFTTVFIPFCYQGATGLQLALSSTRDTYTAYAHGHFVVWSD